MSTPDLARLQFGMTSAAVTWSSRTPLGRPGVKNRRSGRDGPEESSSSEHRGTQSYGSEGPGADAGVEPLRVAACGGPPGPGGVARGAGPDS